MTADIATYYQRIRLWRPTGVGKHIANMTAEIEKQNGPLLHLHAKDDFLEATKRDVPEQTGGISVKSLPLPRRPLEAAWLYLDQPSVELFGVRPDWIYCPAEYYVARKKAGLAVTIHCDNWFNDNLPWFNDPDITETRRRRFKLYQKMTASADVVFCVSAFLKNRIAETFNVEESRLAVVGNGVEAAFFSPSPAPQHLVQQIDGRPYLVVIGGLTRRKGAPVTLETIRKLCEISPEIRIVIVGSSEEDFGREAAMQPNVIMAGYVGVDDGLPGLVANAVALLFLSEYETFGIPALEAMATGTLPIVSDKGALPEVVGDCGLVVGEDALGDLPNVIRRIADLPSSNEARQNRIARASQFSWENCAARVLERLQNT